ncbi:hypothetical protein [Salipiger thiooxidans]|jgi:hypothetical protein|uniref:Uncharacterized protein n=1 Tax=Salipiger thiooxidans TaxID=282683 RepID=A0A1G7H6G5_9RHOB|nr:hypothetical protein [Salipiger thiooxidans]MBR9840669.1 hypothetical protein [Paracoccaceae bacterium]MCA0848425.1 hypothetical protein [Salipiger thiooxidans]SDE95986.1 hypothetical protein SAMN04488105_11087 [Salipiger thiooxidans]
MKLITIIQAAALAVLAISGAFAAQSQTSTPPAPVCTQQSSDTCDL